VRLLLRFVTSLALIGCVQAWGQPQFAPEGHGLIPRPTSLPVPPGGVPPSHPFEPDPSGGFSRIVFETDEHPDFHLIVREFSIPPDPQSRIVILPPVGLFQFLGGPSELVIANRRTTLTPGSVTALAAGTPIEVVSGGEQHFVVRALIVESK
jgi:hypothetical protein